VAAAEATADKEAATKQTKKSTRNHEDNERVLSNARNQTMKEKRMSAKETVLRDHQCKEKNIYKKNEKHLCIYL